MNYHQDKLLLCAIDMVILVVFLLPSNSFCYPCVRQYPVHWKYQKKKRECPCPSRNFLSLVALEFNIKLNKHHMTSVLNKYKVKLSQYHVIVV